MLKKLIWVLSFIASFILLLCSVEHWVGLNIWEVIGFITGGYCVWLCVVENIWNWPIGILNAFAFTVLFLHSKLFADAGLQIIYIILGFVGWYLWLRGGQHKSKLKVGHVRFIESLILTALAVISTYFFTIFLRHIHDVAPFLDALTTVTSLVAQYMLTRKYFENWWVWIGTDVIYVGLYSFKHLILTSVLYILFLGMCFVGVRDWRRSEVKDRRTESKALALKEATL